MRASGLFFLTEVKRSLTMAFCDPQPIARGQKITTEGCFQWGMVLLRLGMLLSAIVMLLRTILWPELISVQRGWLVVQVSAVAAYGISLWLLSVQNTTEAASADRAASLSIVLDSAFASVFFLSVRNLESGAFLFFFSPMLTAAHTQSSREWRIAFLSIPTLASGAMALTAFTGGQLFRESFLPFSEEKVAALLLLVGYRAGALGAAGVVFRLYRVSQQGERGRVDAERRWADSLLDGCKCAHHQGAFVCWSNGNELFRSGALLFGGCELDLCWRKASYDSESRLRCGS